MSLDGYFQDDSRKHVVTEDKSVFSADDEETVA